jgi:hypothetical protein
MTFWKRFRNQFGPGLTVKGARGESLEIAVDLDEELAESSQVAHQTADAETFPSRGGVSVTAPLAPRTPDAIEFEYVREEAAQDAEASEQH